MKYRDSRQGLSGAKGFDAFISYSHAADGRLAPALQAGLGSLAKPWYRRRALRVFRDQSSLAASPHLWPAIEEALSRSRYFILLASPEAADSPWVEQEVRWWRANRGRETLLIALTEGELGWDGANGDFAAGAPIPPALRGWAGEEPLWVDLRRARGERDRSMRNPHFRAAVADLAAPLRGLPKDELIGEDIDQHRRTLRLARAAGAILLVLLIAALAGGLFALVQRNKAEEERTLAFARELAAQAVAQQATDPERALLLAIEAVRRRAVPETEAALRGALAGNRLQAVMRVSERPVSSAEVDPDGETVLTAGNDGKARLTDLSKQAATRVLRAGPPGPTDAVFARHGRLVLTTNAHSGARLWSAAEGRPLLRVPRRSYVSGGAIAPDGSLIAVIERGGVHLWTRAGKSRGMIGSSRDPIESVAFSPDGTLLAIGDWLGTIRIRRLLAGTTGPKLHGEPGRIASLAFDPSGRFVFAAGEGGTAMAWDVVTGEPRTLLKQPSGTFYPEEAEALSMSPDGILAVGNGDGTLIAKDAALGGRIFKTQTGSPVSALDFFPDGERLVSAHDDGKVRVFTVSPTTELIAALGPPSGVRSIALSPDGSLAAETFSPMLNPQGMDISALPVGTWVWRLEDRRLWKVPTDRGDLRASFSPDGHLLAVAGLRSTAVWPLFGNRPVLRLPGAALDVAFSPDGAQLAVAERGGDVELRRVSDGHLAEVLPDAGRRGAQRVAFSPDGSKVLVLGVDGMIELWDLRMGTVHSIGNGRSRFGHVAFSPRGDAIAALSNSRLAIVDLETNEPVWSAPISAQRLGGTAFSSDGGNVIVAGTDGRARAFTADGLLPVTDFVSTGESLTDVAFGHDSTSVAVAGDGGLKVYRCELCASGAQLLATAEKTAIRGLSEAERRRFLPGS